MQLESLWNLVPRINTHLYCARKNAFLMKEDIYNDWALFIVEDGIMQYHLGAKTGTIKAGEMLLCPPGITVKRKTITPLSFHFIRFSWEGSNSLAIPKGKIRLSSSQRLTSTLSTLRKAAEISGEFGHCIKNHLLHDIWLLYLYDLKVHSMVENIHTNDEKMQTAMNYIQEHVYEKMNIKQVADMVGLTPVQFERRFKKAFLIAPKEYVIALRLKKAKSMLLDTEMTLAQIADLCGYDNEYYFSNVFKKHFETAPSRYRKLHKL